EAVRVVPEFPERLGLRRRRQLRVRLGQVLLGQVGRLVLSDPQVDRVDLPRPQRRERGRQPGRDGARVADLVGGGPPAQVQVRGQLVGRELPHRRVPRQARDGRAGIGAVLPAAVAAASGGAARTGTGGGIGRGTGGGGGAAEVGAGGELADRGHLGPGRERPDPPDRGDDADQVVIGQRRQDLVIGGGGVHQGGQHRARVHLL